MHAKHETNHIKSQQSNNNNHREQAENATHRCNCCVKETCPVDKKCQTLGIIFQVTVTRQDNSKNESYVGLTTKHLRQDTMAIQTASETITVTATAYRLQQQSTADGNDILYSLILYIL